MVSVLWTGVVILLTCHCSSSVYIHNISPRSGSLAGGARVTIDGSGFSPDQYEGANHVFFGGIPCDVDWFNSANEKRLVCWTRPWPKAREEQSSSYLQTDIVVGRLSVTETSRWSRQHRYYWWSTPRMESVAPRSSIPGTVLVMKGWFVTSNIHNVQRVMVGHAVCELYKPDSSELYRTNGWHRYEIYCLPSLVTPGFYNATVHAPAYGWSWNHSKSLQPGPDGHLYMFELHPDITSVYPSIGSSDGGTLLRIRGSGFGNQINRVSVDVDGIPCNVKSISNNLLTCLTGRPPSNSQAIFKANRTSIPYFEGVRGATMTVWNGISGTYVSDLQNSLKYPNYPDVYHNVDQFSSPYHYGSRYGLELEAFFTSHYDSWHTFYFASDDAGELWMSNSTNTSEIWKIASINRHSWVSYYKLVASQISKPVYLRKGQKCYLKALAKEHGGADFAMAAVLVHNPHYLYTSLETKSAVAERQEVRVTALSDPEIHSIVVNYPSSAAHLTSAFHLEWGSRSSSSLSVEATDEEVQDAVLGLFGGKCIDNSNKFIDLYDIDTFDEEGSDVWSQLDSRPKATITFDDAYCGRQSLQVVSGYSLNFDRDIGLETRQEETGYSTVDYPYICMAYRIPTGTHSVLVVNVDGRGWYSIPLTEIDTVPKGTRLPNWQDENGEPVKDDNHWHYSCFDLGIALATELGEGQQYFVVGIGFASPEPDYRTGPFYIDEFSVASEVRHLVQTEKPARPNGLVLHSVTVSSIRRNISENVRSVEFDLQYQATTCFDEFSVIAVNVSSEAASKGVNVSTSVMQSASDAIEGTFRLAVFGSWTPNITHDATVDEFKTALESIPGLGEVAVSVSAHDSERGCTGHKWQFTLTDVANDVPLVHVSDQLQGHDVTISTTEIENGGILFDPIPGYMLQTVERTPHVHVTVNGIRASCQGSGEKFHATRYSQDTSCQFIYSHDAKPVVSSLSPTSGVAGDTVLIYGSGFDLKIEEYDIRFGDVACNVTYANETEVHCIVGQSHAGKHLLHFQVFSSGKASTSLFFMYELNFVLESPTEGGLKGGLIATLIGHGFVDFDQNGNMTNQTVLFGSTPCDVITSGFSILQCLIPANDVSAVVNVTVLVYSDGDVVAVTVKDGFTYSNASTPHVYLIQPNMGSAGGGTVVTLSGSGFSINTQGNSVKIGEAVCSVTSASNDSVTCVTSSMQPGTYDVVVLVAGSGTASGSVAFTYELIVEDVSYFAGSLLGGQRIMLYGAGFSDTASVLLGDIKCEVETATSNSIQCVTQSSTKTHYVDNFGYHSEYGVGYQWRPENVTIQVGDTVEWEWTGSAFTTLRSVVQVADQNATQYDGVGFRSTASTSGRFRHTFDQPGIYHYVSEGHGELGFRGSVTVTGLKTKVVPIEVSVNGISADHGRNLLEGSFSAISTSCDVLDMPDNVSHVAYYAFSVCVTPLITEIDPPVVYLGEELIVRGTAFAKEPYAKSLNTLTIGGKSCLTSPDSRLSPEVSVNATTFNDSEIGRQEEIRCAVPKLPPGLYRAVVHVAGRGWAFGYLQMSTVAYQAIFSFNYSSGSVHGGTKLSIPGVGFHPRSALSNRVTIGTAVCDVQSLVDSDEFGKGGSLTCITRKTLDDGYSTVVKEDEPLAYWQLNDKGVNNAYFIANNSGLLGSVADAHAVDWVQMGVHGISRNNWTNSAVRFDTVWLTVPYLSKLNSPSNLSGELWLKVENAKSAYQFVMGSYVSGRLSEGYLIWINPCEEVEFWLAVNVEANLTDSHCGYYDEHNTAESSSGSNSVGVGTNLNSCEQCKGMRTVSWQEAEQTGLPAGVWSVVTGSVVGNSWSHIVFSWTLNDLNVDPEYGQQLLYMEGQLVHNRTTSFSHNTGSDLQIGGQRMRTYNTTLKHFVGVIDEVALYKQPLNADAVARHYYFGTTDVQPVIIQYDTEDHRGIGTVPNVKYPLPVKEYTDKVVNWTSVGADAYIEPSERLQFYWTGFHSLVQVGKNEFESCRPNQEKRIIWGLPQSDGKATVVDLESGRKHYFISDVNGDCETGHKLQIFVGSERVIDWGLGHIYEAITISQGTGLRFQWFDGPSVYHDVVEVASKEDLEECAVGSVAEVKGSVIARYSQPATSGSVVLPTLTIGTHYFACAVSGHCGAGMHIAVTVTGDGEIAEDNSGTDLHQTVHVHWRLQSYSDIVVTVGDTVVFDWDEFHSLSQVSKTAYDQCDIASPPLKEWARSSVTGTVAVSRLAPGTYYFICAVGGHCGAGMKVTVIVKAKSDGPLLEKPLTASCVIGYCSYGYHEDDTPVLLSIEPNHGVPGTVVTIVGERLVKEDFEHNGSLSSFLEIRVGLSLCKDAVLLSSSDNHTVSCVVTANQPAGNKVVSVLVYDSGFGTSDKNVFKLSNPLIFMVDSTIEIVSPAQGSIAGGTDLTITGSGFSFVDTAITVMIGDLECHVMESSFNDIKCVTSSAENSVGVHDSILPIFVSIDSIDAKSSANFTYSTNSTPFIFNVSNSVLVSGNEITISGQFYSMDNEKIEIYVVRKGSGIQSKRSISSLPNTRQECKVTAVSVTAISCMVGPRVGGDHYIVVARDTAKGYALASPASAADVAYQLQVDYVSPSAFGLGGGVEMIILGTGFLSATVDGQESYFRFSRNSSYVDTQKEAVSFGQSLVSSNLHGKLVSHYGIDYGVTYSISVCGKTCYIQQSTYNKTICIVPPVEFNENITAADLTDFDQSCGIEAVISGSSGSARYLFGSNVTYSSSITATIESVSPRIGGTAGGTVLTIIGSGFNSTIKGEQVDVAINGVECSVQTSSDSQITCRTNPHKTTLKGRVTVIVPGKGSALELFKGNFTLPSSAQFEYVDRWSSPYTWGGNDPPGEGAAVHIQAGQTVLLDTSPVGVLSLLVLHGNLIFDDNQDIHLQAKYIFINGGTLQIGTEQDPFMHRAVITLHGNIRDPEIPIYGAKVLGLRRGSLEMHGRPRAITWTRLAQTVHKREHILELVEPVDWEEDDVIVIASTSKDGNETETASISSIDNGGYRIVLHNPVNYTHYGITDVLEDGQFIDIRAEVGLLSHNVIVQGSQYIGDHLDELGADQYGSQIMIHRAGADPTPIRLENVEVRHAGQAFRLGRYAVHFHLSDKMNGSYVRHCSIHHSHNRAITAHGVHEMLFEGVVAYDIKGHTFFIEDGIETGNHYIRNLGLVTRGSSSLLNTDQLPATFWITNPNNTFIGNAAAGSRAYGFWYDLDPNPSGPSFTRSVCPNQTPLGEFRDNVAHTNAEFGFRIWEKYIPKEHGCSGDDVPANFYNLLTYANGIHGVELSVVGHVRLIGFKVADNRDNGIEILEAHGSWGGPMIKEALIISHTVANQGKPQTGGIKTPNKRRLTISNVTFSRFDNPSLSCLRACSHCKVRQGGFQYWFEKIKYLGNSSFHKTAFRWEHEVLFKDLDGTLAGVPGGWVTPSNGLLPHDHCDQRPEYSLNPSVPGSVCTPSVQILRLAWNNVQPLATFRGRDVVISNRHGYTQIPWRHYRLTHMDGYMLTLPSHLVHNLTYELPATHDVDNTAFSAGLYNVPVNESVIISSLYDTAPDHFRVGFNRIDIGRPLMFTDPHTSWHFNNRSLELQYILSTRSKSAELSDLIYSFSKEPCPVDGCPVPVIDDSGYETNWRRWSNPLDWPNERVPLSGSNVTILSSWKMYLDVAEVNVEKLEIQGKLKFEDKKDVVLNATWIVIIGIRARLEVGLESSRFTHQATINLKGNRRTPDYVLSRSMIVGSKAIGVFGELHLFGSQRRLMWTHLSESALTGQKYVRLESSTGTDWRSGDEIVIAPSGYIPSEAEIRTISAVSGNKVEFEEPLLYDHEVDPFLTGNEMGTGNEQSRWWHAEGGVRVSPAVGILSHNVKIIGTEDIYDSISVHEFGCRVLVGYVRRGRSTYVGKAFIDSVQFKHCGQGGFFSTRDPRYVVAFKSGGYEAAGSFVRRSSVHTGFNTAFGLLASNGIELSDNVVYRSVDSMFRLISIGGIVERNLGVLTRSIQVARPGDNHAVDFPATFEISGSNHIVKDNVAAGSERVGFYYPGESCINDVAPDSNTAKFWGNSAVSGMMGLVVMGLRQSCSAVGGFMAARQWEYGIFSSIASSLAVRQVAVAVGHTGLCLNLFGPDPVKHLVSYKWIKVEDSLVVGSTKMEPCFSSTPSHCPSICATAMAPKLGIMMASFAKRQSKMDGTGPWHRVKSYPAVAGQVNVSSVTFARFKTYERCTHSSYVIGNNQLSPDAMHPNYFRDSGLIEVEPSNVAHLWPPNPAWIVQEDCVDMDCDGPKHSLINDIDGRLVGTSGTRGSIIPQAEIRFDITRLPEAMRYSVDDPTTRLKAEDIVEHRGIARGSDGTFDGNSPGCEWMSSWNAYKCSGLNHQMLIIESMDADSEVRRVSPIALHGGDTGSGKYTDLMNGPMDHGWCTYYTCLKRLSTFFSIVAVGTDYQLWFTGSNPGHLRFHLLNTYGGPSDTPGEGVRISIWYKNPQRKDVYKDGVYLEPSNSELQKGGGVKKQSGDQYIPELSSSHSGANYFSRRSQILHLVVKGSKPIEVTTPPVVQVSFDLAVGIDDFFDPVSIVRNLAFVLRIPESLITIVDVIAEDTQSTAGKRKRGLLAATEAPTQSLALVIEIGDPPAKNISQPETQSVEEQVEEEGGVSPLPVNDDGTENETLVTDAPPPAAALNITADGDDVPNNEELANQYLADSQQFSDNQKAYAEAVEKTNYLNGLANMLVEQVQTGQLKLDNASVTGMSVAAVPPPPKPVEPVVPPGFENLTSSTGEKIYTAIDAPTSPPLVIDSSIENNDTDVVFQIPARATVSRQPLPVSGHLVFVSVVVEDANRKPVENLGLTQTWQCTVSLIYDGLQDNRTILEGETTVHFRHGGYAHFTHLRVNQAADNLFLQFFISPANYSVRTANPFSVVSPTAATTEHKKVQFAIQGNYENIVLSGANGKDGFLQELKNRLGETLNIDISRIADMDVFAGSIVCVMTILERAKSDPPGTPSLAATVDYLRSLVETGLFTMTYESEQLTAIRTSFQVKSDSDDDDDNDDKSSGLAWWIIAVAATGAVLFLLLLLLLWLKVFRSATMRIGTADRWAQAPKRRQLVAVAQADERENLYVEPYNQHLEMVTFYDRNEELITKTKPSSLEEPRWATPVDSITDRDRGLTPVGSTTGLLPESQHSRSVSPTYSNKTSTSSFRNPTRTSLEHTRQVVVSPTPSLLNPKFGTQNEGQISYTNDAGATEIVVLPGSTKQSKQNSVVVMHPGSGDDTGTTHWKY